MVRNFRDMCAAHLVHSKAGWAEASFVVPLCPSCCHPPVKQNGTFSGFLALKMWEGEIHQEINVSRNSF